ncbi:MAG TPA: glycoside hydrolase family 125 protein [Clostridiales bacterium]|nr:glycoside hydrolase family 125 protein [Clostridiales bacterium]
MKPGQPIVSIPDKLDWGESYIPTGNEYIAIPCIDTDTAGIKNFNTMFMRYRVLLEVGSDERQKDCYLFVPLLEIEGQPHKLDKSKLVWKKLGSWVPSFTYEDQQVALTGTIVAPLKEKGFMYILNLTNKGQDADFTLGLKGMTKHIHELIFSRQSVCGVKNAQLDQWTKNLVLGFKSYNGSLAYAIGSSMEDVKWEFYGKPIDINKPVQYKAYNKIHLEQGQGAEVCFYISVNLEEDGAAANLIHLKRRGYKQMLEETLNWLRSKEKSHEDKDVQKIANENLFFNYFFSVGKAMDTDEYAPLTSRSPLYDESGAFRERDSLLWSMPALTMVDKTRASKVLEFIFEHHFVNAGQNIHYIDGRVLFPGFGLDQVAAYYIALENYIDATEDYDILNRGNIREALSFLEGVIDERYDEDVGLYSTFLLPSNHPAEHPFVIYDNVLVWKAFCIMNRLNRIMENFSLERYFEEKADALKDKILQHGIVEVGGKKIFAWSTDGRGGHRIYNDPSGSLVLLSYLGFVDEDDDVYTNTLEYLYSKDYKYYMSDADFDELACSRHPNSLSTLGLCAGLLSPRRKKALKHIKRMPMDSGLFCERVYPDTGIISSGAAFAAGAGFLAWALLQGE